MGEWGGTMMGQNPTIITSLVSLLQVQEIQEKDPYVSQMLIAFALIVVTL